MKRQAFTFGAALVLALSAWAGPAKVVRDIAYNEAAGRDGLGDLYLPADVRPDTPVVLTIHGGGWSGGDRASWSGVAEYFRSDLGFAAFNIEYRLVKRGPWPLCGNDCLAAGRFLLSEAFQKKYGLACRKIWVCGGSAGGHLALWTGLSLPSDQVAGIVSISGIGDLAQDEKVHRSRYVGLFGHQPSVAELAAASPLSLVAPKAPPIFCSHATVDGAVPFEAEKTFVDVCRKAGVKTEFYVYEKRDRGHSIWIPGSSPHKLFPDIEAAITKFVKEKR